MQKRNDKEKNTTQSRQIIQLSILEQTSINEHTFVQTVFNWGKEENWSPLDLREYLEYGKWEWVQEGWDIDDWAGLA